MEIKLTLEELAKKKLFVATPMFGGMCLNQGVKIITEDGEKSIKWIVDNKYSGKVLSFNDNNLSYEWNNVIGHSVVRNGFRNNKESKKGWVRVKTSNSGTDSLICTSDHECAVVNDIFDPKIDYSKANDLLSKYIVQKNTNPFFNKVQLSIIFGMLLGDGTVNKQGAFKVTHCTKQKKYLEFIQNILGGSITENKISGFHKEPTYTLYCPVNAQTKSIRELLYSNGKKEIYNIIDYIDEKSLAFWYMDDGYIIKNDRESPYLTFCVDSFSQEESQLLCNRLLEKWNIKATVFKYKNNYRIRISSYDTNSFLNIIAPYISDDIKYKFTEGFVFPEKYIFDSCFLDFGVRKVVEVKNYKKPSQLYDITVENTHNFFANNTLVHNCGGMYTKSMCDLSAIATRYNIELQYFALFNESLVTRARNYCVDEFMRSKMDYFLFLDADIGFDPSDIIAMMGLMTPESPYDVLCAPYPKKSVISSTCIETEDGPKTIGWIVRNKYNGKVLSLDDNGKFTWNNVVEHYVTPYKDSNKKWVKIGRYGRKNLTCTDDHELYVIDDPFSSNIYKIEAKNAVGKYIIKNPVKNGKNSINALYNKDQMSFLIGTLFGDGCVNNKGYLKFGHSDAQKEYIELKQQIFGGKISPLKKTGEYKGKEYFGYFLECPRNAQVEKLREMFYPEGKKTIKNVINLLDEKGLAFWYLDDGYLSPQHSTIISSQGFSYEDHEIIQKYLKDKWNIDSNITKSGDNFRFYVTVDGTKKLFEIIAPYVPTSMKYKLSEEYRNTGVEWNYENLENLDYAVELIKEVRYITDNVPRRQYDIGVENNHNFLADGYIVKNCISWEKILQAVNKGVCGPNDENPNVLDKYVGDFVFNPKSGTGNIAIGSPCEILEGGTGFMMMRRNTLTKFQEAFPQYMYKPDHVRTAAFDGSREICQFFQAEIDPVSKRYLSEDYWFSQKCQEIGLKIWLCPWMKTSHMGTMIYGGTLADLASIGASPTADASKLGKKA